MRLPKSILIIYLSIYLLGCAHDPNSVKIKTLSQVPAVHQGQHIVKPKETLHLIAWMYGRDVSDLAEINSLTSPYTIYPNQLINLSKNKVVFIKKKIQNPTASNTLNKKKSLVSRTKYKNKSHKIEWQWPLKGKIIKPFSLKGKVNKGIDIKSKSGNNVMAAADGLIVYAGDDLTGYGNLIIIEHGNNFLSAYAHNRKLLVKEQQKVKKGQKIAEVGSMGSKEPKLHFEIRHKGTPNNPLRYLPVM